MRLRHLFLSVLAGMIIQVPTTMAHQGATGVVKERMMLMKGIKKDMKQIKQLALGVNPGNNEALGNLLRSLRSRSKEILPLFPEGSLQHPTEALAEIWQDWPEFRKLTAELDSGLDQLEQSLRDGPAESIKPQLKKIAQTCSGCHDRFREEK